MLDVLFSPKSVAVVGASSNPDRWGNWAAEQVATHKHLRNVYLVNPLRKTIHDIQSVAAICEIPEPLDVAIVTVPHDAVENTIDQLLKHGTKVIVCITVGFGERDQEGLETEQRIADKVLKAGSILIGPNCAGVLNTHSPFQCLPILANSSIGNIGLISQSGGIVAGVHTLLKELGLGFSLVASVGNCAGVSIEDLVATLDQDPNTKIIALYLENDNLVPAFDQVTKPVVVMMPHHTPTSIKAARRHTNSHLVGASIDYVDSIGDFIGRIQALNSNQFRTGEQVMIVTDTGGVGVLAAAEAEHNFVQLTKLYPNTMKSLQCELRILPQAVLDNPLDLVGIPTGFSTAAIRAMRVLQHAPEVDALIFILFVTEENQKDEYAIGVELARSARAGRKPVVFVTHNFKSQGVQALLKENMPVYKDVGTAVHMVRFLCGS